MSSGLTVNSLTTTIRQRADQIGSTTFDDASEIKVWIRASVRQLQQILSQADVDWYTTRAPLSLHAGMASYTMPADMRRISAVYALFNYGGNRIPLKEFDQDNFGVLNTPYYQNQPMQYRLIRNLLWIQPTPSVDLFNALEIVYVPEGRSSMLDHIPIDDMLPSGSADWVVLDVLQKMAIKTRLQNMDDILKSKAAQEQRILRTFKNRSDTAPRMRDQQRYVPQPVGYAAPQGPLVWVAA